MALHTDRTEDETTETLASQVAETSTGKPDVAQNTTLGDDAAVRATSALERIDTLQQELDQELAVDKRTADTADGSENELGFELPTGFVLSIIVPIYNEVRTINRVISSLFALPLPIEVIAVDDGSTDGTCAQLTRLNQEFPELRVVFQETNQGKGAALRRGFSLATGSHVMVQDADLEYNPRDIPNLIEPLAKDEADVVYGSRFLEERWEGSSFIHRFGNGVLTKASNWMTGWNLTDMETCYKVLRRSLMEGMNLEQNGFGFEVELTAKLAKQGARVVERPIGYDARGWEEGKKIGWKDAVQALYCICRYR